MNDKPITQLADELLALEEKATPAPWETDGYHQCTEEDYQATVRSQWGPICWLNTKAECYNHEFIAASRNSIRTLALAVKEMAGVLEDVIEYDRTNLRDKAREVLAKYGVVR